MKQLIPFSKEIVFKTNIANILSISLEHEEKIIDGEVSGDFIIFGEYKVHNDTTEKELFKYRLPFTALIPDNIDKESIVIDIVDFHYDLVDNDVLKVDISFSLEGNELDNQIINEEKEDEKRNLEEELNEFLDSININKANDNDNKVLIENDEKSSEVEVNEIIKETKKSDKEVVSENSEYVTYHVHLVKEEETLESILRDYNISLEYVKEYNDVTNIKVGDKLIIPYLDNE